MESGFNLGSSPTFSVVFRMLGRRSTGDKQTSKGLFICQTSISASRQTYRMFNDVRALFSTTGGLRDNQ